MRKTELVIFAALVLAVLEGVGCSSYSMLHNYRKRTPHVTAEQPSPFVTAASEQQGEQQGEEVQDPSAEKVDFLIDEEFKGEYQSEQKDNLFDYLTSEKGDIEALLYKDQFSSSAFAIDKFVMILFNPVYHDQKAIRLEISLGKMISQGVWEGNNSQANIGKFWKEREVDSYNISNLNYSIKIDNVKSQDISKVKMILSFQGSNFHLKSQLNYNNDVLSSVGYCFYVSAVVTIQILSAYVLLSRIETTNPNIANKLSLTTAAICNIQDFYLTMMHIEYIMTLSSSAYLLYVIPSVAYIILFVIFDMKLLFIVWRSHYMREIDNPQALRKKLTTFYIKFYVGLFAYLTLTYFFTYDVWMIIIQNLFILPQIVHNARVGNNPGFQPLYVFGYLGARFLIPMYERACPSNHFLLTPMTGLVISLALLYALQILVLFLQYKVGPRFFVPKMFQPDFYDYNFKLKSSEETRDLQCSICLQVFFEQQNIGMNGNLNSSSISSPMLLKQKTVMKTPCNHYFHRDCLLSWTDVKLECPTCRRELPPL